MQQRRAYEFDSVPDGRPGSLRRNRAALAFARTFPLLEEVIGRPHRPRLEATGKV
jgi:hypothetical protein